MMIRFEGAAYESVVVAWVVQIICICQRIYVILVSEAPSACAFQGHYSILYDPADSATLAQFWC
jgi:hypothetical protein